MDLVNSTNMGKVITRGVSQDLCLGKTDLYRLETDRRKDTVIMAVEGSLWVTRENDPKDYVLEAGSRLVLRGAGTALVQGLPAGRLRVIG